MGYVVMEARPFNIDHRIDEVDPTCVLYLPLYKLPGEVFYSRDRGWQKATNSGSIWTPKGRIFDGVDDYVDLGASPALDFTTGPFTIICRITPLGIGYHWTISRGSWPLGYYYGIQVRPTAKIGLLCWGEGLQGHSYSTPGSIEANVPVTIGGTRQDTSLHLYLNGALDDADVVNAGSPTSNAGPTKLGYNTNVFAEAGNQIIHWLAVFSRALTPQEHANIYLATRGAD